MRHHNRRRLDVIVFMAILAAGTLLTILGVSASSLATISVALSGLYGTWTGVTRSSAAPQHSHEPPGEPPWTG